MTQLVKLETFHSEMTAEISAAVLREAGIEAFIHCDDAGGFEPQLQITRGVDLLVEEADFDRALKSLASARSSPSTEPTSNP